MIELYKGDCLEVMKEIESGSVDAIICDPPFGTTSCKWDSVIDFELMWEQLNRIIKPNGAIVLFGSEPFSSYLRMSNIKNYKYDWVWYKNKSGNVFQYKISPMKRTENIMVFLQQKLTAQNSEILTFNVKTEISKKEMKSVQVSGGVQGNRETKSYKGNTGYDDNVLKYSVDNNRKHPTQKPVSLMEYLIKTYTNENETVLDFTMGSGSTGVACKQTNRNFIGIEKEEKYFKIASERINGTLF